MLSLPPQLLRAAVAASPLHLSRDSLKRLLASSSFFWIDLARPKDEDFAVLRDVFHFHPLALEDSEDFGQRAKLDDYDDFVFHGRLRRRPGRGPAGRVHCFSSECFLLTIHRDEAPAFTEVWHGYQKRKAPIDEPAPLLYRFIDAVAVSATSTTT